MEMSLYRYLVWWLLPLIGKFEIYLLQFVLIETLWILIKSNLKNTLISEI